MFYFIHSINSFKPLMKNVGLGRLGYLKNPIKITEVISIMKNLLNQQTFRLALANGRNISKSVK